MYCGSVSGTPGWRVREVHGCRPALSAVSPTRDTIPGHTACTQRPRTTKAPRFAGLSPKRLKGLEPSTFCMASRRSSQLSYSRAGEEHSNGSVALSASSGDRAAGPEALQVGVDRAGGGGGARRVAGDRGDERVAAQGAEIERRADRADRRGAAPVAQERDLAEAVAGAQAADRSAVADDLGLAGDDHVEVTAG